MFLLTYRKLSRKQRNNCRLQEYGRIPRNRAVFDGGSGGFDPPQEVADPPESSAEPLWGVDSNPPKIPQASPDTILAKPV